MKRINVELMAPVGSFASLQAAIDAGADSVYFGVTQLNMRARAAANFGLDDLEEICRIANIHAIKTYLTVNTLLYQHDLTMVKMLIDHAKKHGVSAVICADMAAIQYARSIDQTVHISTQLSISNIDSLRFYSQFADTIVLARELDLEMIKEICDQIKEERILGPSGKLIQIEIFVHGALCIAQSGRCTMSLFTDNSSANRGACKQTCRHAYKISNMETGEELQVENNYVLSPADLCCINFLDQVIETGVSVLKIEGRGRSADYVYKVIKAYREAIDTIKEGTYTAEKVEKWLESLKSVYNRGLDSGWYLGKPIPEWSKAYGSKATKEKVFLGKVAKYYPKAQVVEMSCEAFDVNRHDIGVIIGDKTGCVECDFSSLRNEDGDEIERAQRKAVITFKMKTPVNKNDTVYIVKPRDNDNNHPPA